MTAPASTPSLRELTQRFRAIGRIEAILLRPARLLPMRSVAAVPAEVGRGLIGDRRSLASRNGPAAQKREVTLIQARTPAVAGALVRPDRTGSGAPAAQSGGQRHQPGGDAVAVPRYLADLAGRRRGAVRNHRSLRTVFPHGGRVRHRRLQRAARSWRHDGSAGHGGHAARRRQRAPRHVHWRRGDSASMPEQRGPIKRPATDPAPPGRRRTARSGTDRALSRFRPGAGRPSHAEFFPPED